MTLKQLLRDDDSAVSPVIGVILMVAITVILAAVIASFVLGLGDQGDPAPTPTIESSVDEGTLALDVTGGDDFSASDANVQFSATMNDTENGGADSAETVEESISMSESSNTYELNGSSELLEVSIDSGEEVSAGDSITIGPESDTQGFQTLEKWEVEIIWNPADQDSQVIYSESS